MTPSDSLPPSTNPTLPSKRLRKRIHHLHITREGIYNTINLTKNGGKVPIIYNLIILFFAIMNAGGIYYLMMAYSPDADLWRDFTARAILCYISGGILVIDYILRWVTADYRLKRGRLSFLLYPITFLGLMDMLAFFPTFVQVGNGLQFLKLLRFFVLIRKIRQKKFDINQYVHGITEIADIFKKMRIPFISAGVFVIFFILFAALILFSVEPKTFDNSFLKALYWATISVTGVGYGDITPKSDPGMVITTLSSLISVILIALPVSVVTAGITAGYLRKTFNNKEKKTAQKPNNNQDGTNTATSKDKINYCTECGTKCSQKDKYCKNCGNKLR